MGAFFTVITLGLASTLPPHLYSGLVAQGVPTGAAHAVSSLPPIGTLFSAFLGYNAVQIELGHTGVLATLPHSTAAYLTGRQFFPHLISSPFAHGLHLALYFAAAVTLVAAVASVLRGARYVHQREPLVEEISEGFAGVGELASQTVQTATVEAAAVETAAVESGAVESRSVEPAAAERMR
jgi:hypothetical protein